MLQINYFEEIYILRIYLNLYLKFFITNNNNMLDVLYLLNTYVVKYFMPKTSNLCVA